MATERERESEREMMDIIRYIIHMRAVYVLVPAEQLTNHVSFSPIPRGHGGAPRML